MPRGDGTGHQSQGKGTGRGQGGCKSGKGRRKSVKNIGQRPGGGKGAGQGRKPEEFQETKSLKYKRR